MKKIIYILVLLASNLYAQDYTIGATTVNVSVLNDEVNIPWDVSWGPDHMLWVTDGPTVKKLDPKTGDSKVIWTSPRMKDGFPIGNGLGLTFHPDFFNTPKVYLALDTSFHYSQNDVVKVYCYDYSFTEDTLLNETLLLEYKTSGEHCGGRMITTADGKIMITTPDYWYDLPESSLQGRTLRFNPDGTIPSDNPFGNYTYSVGHRNAQGLLQIPNGNIFVSEHGQWNDDQDELNLIVPGGNYGWPAYDGTNCSGIVQDTCDSPTFSFISPLDGGRNPPAGIDYYNHPAIPEFANSIVESTLGSESIIVFNLNSAGNAVLNKNIYFYSEFSRIRDICTAPSGEIYFISNDRMNSDIWTNPVTSDGQIRRLKNKHFNHCTPTSSVAHHEICNGDSVIVDGIWYKQTQNVSQTLVNADGCDSLIIHVIEVAPTYQFNLSTIEICEGDSAEIFGEFQKTSGVYLDEYTTSLGCDSIYEQELIVNTINTNVNTTNTPELAALQTGATYQWLTCPAMSNIASENNQLFTAENTGEYAVEISNSGCKDTSDCISVLITSIHGIAHNKIAVYPNPVVNTLNIPQIQDNNAMVIIGDITGRIIFQSTMDLTTNQVIDFQKINSGIYYIKVSSNNKIYSALVKK